METHGSHFFVSRFSRRGLAAVVHGGCWRCGERPLDDVGVGLEAPLQRGRRPLAGLHLLRHPRRDAVAGAQHVEHVLIASSDECLAKYFGR